MDMLDYFSDDLLLLLLWARQEKMQMRCNGGTRRPGAGVGMACFIEASVERRAAFPVVPCRRLARLMECQRHMHQLL